MKIEEAAQTLKIQFRECNDDWLRGVGIGTVSGMPVLVVTIFNGIPHGIDVPVAWEGFPVTIWRSGQVRSVLG